MPSFIALVGITGISPKNVIRTIRSYEGVNEIIGAYAVGTDGLDGAYIKAKTTDMTLLGGLRERIENTDGVAGARFYMLIR